MIIMTLFSPFFRMQIDTMYNMLSETVVNLCGIFLNKMPASLLLGIGIFYFYLVCFIKNRILNFNGLQLTNISWMQMLLLLTLLFMYVASNW
jgi:hypothetical protein